MGDRKKIVPLIFKKKLQSLSAKNCSDERPDGSLGRKEVLRYYYIGFACGSDFTLEKINPHGDCGFYCVGVNSCEFYFLGDQLNLNVCRDNRTLWRHRTAIVYCLCTTRTDISQRHRFTYKHCAIMKRSKVIVFSGAIISCSTRLK